MLSEEAAAVSNFQADKKPKTEVPTTQLPLKGAAEGWWWGEEGERGSLFSFDKGGLELPWKSWLRCFRGHSLHYSQETLWCWSHSLVTSVTQKCEDSYFSTWQSEAALNHLKMNADENEELMSAAWPWVCIRITIWDEWFNCSLPLILVNSSGIKQAYCYKKGICLILSGEPKFIFALPYVLVYKWKKSHVYEQSCTPVCFSWANRRIPVFLTFAKNSISYLFQQTFLRQHQPSIFLQHTTQTSSAPITFQNENIRIICSTRFLNVAIL